MGPPPTFLTLPRELRDQIYMYVLEPDSQSTPSKAEQNTADRHRPSLTATTLSSLLPQLPALSKVSQQLHHETTPLYLRQCTLVFQDEASTLFFADWINSFGDAAWRAIRYLDFMDFMPTAAPLYHTLLSKCTNLHVLRIVLPTSPPPTGPPIPQKLPSSALRDEAYMADFETRKRQPEESNNARLRTLVATHQLEKLLDFEHLEELWIKLPDERRLRDEDVITYALRAWVVDGLEARGKRCGLGGVNVHVEWWDWEDDDGECVGFAVFD